MNHRFLVSVVLCTHNPRKDFLERTIESLRQQSLPYDLWELCVIDNASDPPLTDSSITNWHPNGRIVQEIKVGLTNARLRGIDETSGNLLVFVDDDNILDSSYLKVALDLADKFHFLGAFGGACVPEFEIQPPSWTERYWCCLAIRSVKSDRWSNRPRDLGCLPVGAGMCVRREVAIAYKDKVTQNLSRRQLDRSGKSLLSGGDHDLAETSCDIGLGFGVLTGLSLTHLLPNERFTPQYLERLMEGISYSGVTLDSLHGILPIKRRGVLNHLADLIRIARTEKAHRKILMASFRGRNRAEAEIFRVIETKNKTSQ